MSANYPTPPTPDLPVVAGLDATVFQSGKLIGWATDAGFDEDFRLEPIETLGRHGPRGHKSVGYQCTFRVSAFVLFEFEPDSMNVPSRRSIIQSGALDFQFVEKFSGALMYDVRKCKCASNSVNIDRSLSRKSTRWEAVEVYSPHNQI